MQSLRAQRGALQHAEAVLLVDDGEAQLAEIQSGAIHLVVGTHALVQGDVLFNRLGLAIIDEQHRFGVAQRATLQAKGLRPDVLLMTATPIPRTLALTDYSELDVSKIVGLPPGRQPISTWVKPESRRDSGFTQVRTGFRPGGRSVILETSSSL